MNTDAGEPIARAAPRLHIAPATVDLSILIPVFNEEESLGLLYEKLDRGAELAG